MSVETAIQELSRPLLDDQGRDALLKLAEEAGREQALEETRAFIAHEVRSAIGPLRIISQMLRDDLDRAGLNHAKATEYIERILQQSEAVYQVVRCYLDYTRPLDPQLIPTKLAPVLQDSLGEIRAECLNRKIQVALSVEPGTQALIDRELMAQVLRNVLQNAIEAMGAGGKLTLSARREKDWVVLEISDTGPGLKPEPLRRVFELGFTTKLGTQGAGVGLALARRIIHEAHSGQISLTNNPNGIGATVTIKLPLAEETHNGSQKAATFDRG
ncbi:MAG: sensor histidine kinase [Blastocatellia bacterium]